MDFFDNLGSAIESGQFATEESDSEDLSSDGNDDSLPNKKGEKNSVKLRKKSAVRGRDHFAEGFQFTTSSDNNVLVSYKNIEAQIRVSNRGLTSLDDKISDVKKQKLPKENDEDVTDQIEDASSDSDEAEIPDKVKEKLSKKKKAPLDANKIKFDEVVDKFKIPEGFASMNLSRPVLKGLTEAGFNIPTPVQAATIPVALRGRDICACAVTGSGKTGAFMLPILERLLFKPRNIGSITRVIIICPTRELSVQVYQVASALAKYTGIEIGLSTGGLDLKAQEAMLRKGPDIVIATPGRLIDHLHNSPNFTLDNIEILVLDEADRMLDEFFAVQMQEVIKLCSRTRQTMLFSATMTEQVNDLASLSLKNPVKVFVNDNTQLALSLKQEFIRIRPNRESDREAIVSALVKRTFRERCIVFIQTKKQAHRLHILLGLLGIKVGELHGDLSQAQRLDTLKRFKDDDLDVLLATDLVARGLDIDHVNTIINFTMPSTLQRYIHRVGRTARAGRSGRAVTLVGEQERKILREIIKISYNPVKARLIPSEVIVKFRDAISNLEKDIEKVLLLEKEEKEMKTTECQMSKAERLLKGSVQSQSESLKRTWFQSVSEKERTKKRLRLGNEEPVEKKKKKSNRQPRGKRKADAAARVAQEILKSQQYAARIAKKSSKPTRMRTFDSQLPENSSKNRKQKKAGVKNHFNKKKQPQKSFSGKRFSKRNEKKKKTRSSN